MQSMTSAPEEWRPIPSCPEYEASSWGRVRQKPRVVAMHHGGTRTYGGAPILGGIRDDGRRSVHVAGKPGKVAVHRMVCEAFHGPAPDDRPICMHRDDDPLNNRPDNLSWGTNAENCGAPGAREKHRERWRSGQYYGVASRLFPEQVQEIRRLLKGGMLQSEIAAEFRVARTTIWNIRHEKTWASCPI